jgi:hypothetical protein
MGEWFKGKRLDGVIAQVSNDLFPPVFLLIKT